VAPFEKSGGTIEGDHGGAPSPVDWGSLYQAEGGSQMMKIAFVLAAAAAVLLTTVPAAAPAKAQDLKMAST